MCENYLVSNHKDDINKIVESPDKEKYFSVNINFLELFEADSNLGNALLTDPKVSLKNWNEAVFHVQTEFLKQLPTNYSLKDNVNCRIYNLPPWPHVSRTTFPGNDDTNKFLQITGTIVRMSARKLLEYQRQYICVACKYLITVEAQYDMHNIIKQPRKCINPEGCAGKTIVTFGELDTYNCKDYQEITIQEDLSKLGLGTMPNQMIVTLEDELVNVCKPGENVTITGIVTGRWFEFVKGEKMIIDIALKANHVQVNNSGGLSIAVSEDMMQFFDSFWERHINEPLVGRNIILQSISPEIYGLHLVKLAIAIVLAGGSQSEENYSSTGIDTRSESHLLLVGDPGTGKSHMLRFASKIIPRSVLTTGVGSTAAGLTVTAVMENGEWQLEAGALVMADGGICCIDEFNSMREHDRTSIHEAMEQQTISVAKAGMVCKLKTRCSILAACNPKGNIDPLKPLCVNVAMSSPLLSRFDLILLLRDIVNEDNDRQLAEHLLNKGCPQQSGDGTIWNLDKLQKYYAVLKKRNPKLTKDSETILSMYYQLQRKFGGRNKSRTTVRLLESLIRLSQGHAKLMYHTEVQVMDAIFAIILIEGAMDIESSILTLNIDNNSFFDNSEQLYWQLLENILGKLNLEYIFQKEIEKVGVGASHHTKKNSPNCSQSAVPHFSFTQGRHRSHDISKNDTHEQIEEAGVSASNQTKRNSPNCSQSTVSRFSFTQGRHRSNDISKDETEKTGESATSGTSSSYGFTQHYFSQRASNISQDVALHSLPRIEPNPSNLISNAPVSLDKNRILEPQKNNLEIYPGLNESVKDDHGLLETSKATRNKTRDSRNIEEPKKFTSRANNITQPIRNLSQIGTSNSNIDDDDLDFDKYFDNIMRSRVSKSSEKVPDEGLNKANNKKRKTSANSPASQNEVQSSVSVSTGNSSGLGKCNFRHSEGNDENSTLVQNNLMNTPSSSKGNQWSKKEEDFQKGFKDISEIVERKSLPRVGGPHSKSTETVKIISELDSDLEFELWLETIKKTGQTPLERDCVLIPRPRETMAINDSGFNETSDQGDKTDATVENATFGKNGTSANREPENDFVVVPKVNSAYSEGNCLQEGLDTCPNGSKKSENNVIDKRKKRRSNSPKKLSEKKKAEKDADVFKLMPSVNDDFLELNMHIDWEMGEEEVQVNKNAPGLRENQADEINNDACEQGFQFSDKSDNETVARLLITNNEPKEDAPNLQQKEFNNPIMCEPKPSKKFNFRPIAKKYNNHQSLLDEQKSDLLTASTTLRTTKSDVANKFNFKRQIADIDFSKLEEEMDSLEQTFCQVQTKFGQNKSHENPESNGAKEKCDNAKTNRASGKCFKEVQEFNSDGNTDTVESSESQSNVNRKQTSQNSTYELIRKFAFSKVYVDEPANCHD